MEGDPCRKKWWQKHVHVYHERQSLLLQHCAVHTLNNVLQAPTYTAKHFEDLAISLQHGQFPVALSETENSSASSYRAADRGQNHSRDRTQDRGKTESVHIAIEQATKLVKVEGKTRGRKEEETENYQSGDALKAQRENMSQVCARQYRASGDRADRCTSADTEEQSYPCTQQTQRGGNTALPLTALHRIASCCRSETGTLSTSNCVAAQVHVNVGEFDRVQLLHSNISNTGLSVNRTRVACPHPARSANCSCFLRADFSREVDAYEFHNSSVSHATASPSIVAIVKNSDPLRVSFFDSSAGHSLLLEGARNTPSAGVCERNVLAAAESGRDFRRCNEECVVEVNERDALLAADEKPPPSAISETDYAAQKTDKFVAVRTRDTASHGKAAVSIEVNQPVCGAGQKFSFTSRVDVNPNRDLTATHPHQSRGLTSTYLASTGVSTSHQRVSHCRSQACKSAVFAANMMQPLKSLSGFTATAGFPRVAVQNSLLSRAPPAVSTSEAGIPWRRRVSSVLLGTDYSAPLGIGNYDLSLLQQLLCLHRLSLNFANNPSTVQTDNDEAGKCRVLSSTEDYEGRNARGDTITGEIVSLTHQQKPVWHQEQHEAPIREQRGQHPQQQLPNSIILPAKYSPSRRVKPHGNSSGWVTIEQLRNPRLLAFILNVRVPRVGWRRLFPMVGADRHFYTIRKVKWETATSVELPSGEKAKRVVSAEIFENTSKLKFACKPVDDGSRSHISSCRLSEERGNNAEKSEFHQRRYQRIREELPFAMEPVCDSPVADAGYMEEESCSGVHSLDGSKQEKAFHSVTGNYGVDFVWLDLDSNLSTPRVFQTENALVIYLNRKLKEALLERSGSRSEQLQQTGQSVQTLPAEDVVTGDRSNVCVVNVGGVKCTASSSGVTKVDSAATLQHGSRDVAVGSWCGVDSDACGQPHNDYEAGKTLHDDNARERVLLDAQETRCRTFRHGEPREPRQCSSNVDIYSSGSEYQSCGPSPSLECRFPVSRQRELKGYSLCGRIEKGRESIVLAKGSTDEDVEEEEAADNTYNVADTERETNALDATGNLVLSDDAADVSEDEDCRGYKDLILIEVLEEEESGEVRRLHVSNRAETNKQCNGI